MSVTYAHLRSVSVPRTHTHTHAETYRVFVVSLQIYTDWANHYLAKSGCQRLIKDLSQDVTDGVLLAQIIQIIGRDTHTHTHTHTPVSVTHSPRLLMPK